MVLDKLQECEERYEDLSRQLAEPQIVQNPAQYQKLAKELGDLREVVEQGTRYRQVQERLEEA